MKKYLSTIGIALIGCIILFAMKSPPKQNSSKINSNTSATNTNDKKAFVLLELFTSQGCSSCPLADELLGTYALQNNPNIITLAFHVDYWNRLGWTDTFSNAKFSERQRNYASIFKAEGVYTPQLIINGTKEMVGSNESSVQTNVNYFLKQPFVNTTVAAVVSKIDNQKVTVNYSVTGALANTQINAALIQTVANTKIKAGENKGVSLTNYSIVRDFVTQKDETGSLELTLPKNAIAQDYSIVFFLQENETGKISAVTKLNLN
jgi:hypothetical protein